MDFYLHMAGLEDMPNNMPQAYPAASSKNWHSYFNDFFPKLNLIDEAFSNIDIESIVRFQDYILETQQKSPAIWI